MIPLIVAGAALAGSALSAASASKANKTNKAIADQQNALNKEQLALEKQQYEDAVKLQQQFGTPWMQNTQGLYNQAVAGGGPQQSYFGMTGTPQGAQGLSNLNAGLAQTPQMQQATQQLSSIYGNGLNQGQLGGLNAMYNQGATGTYGVGAANAELADVLGGKYLSPDSNPYIKDLYTQEAQRMREEGGLGQANINAMFNQSGNMGPGNSSWEETMAKYGYGMNRNLAELATNTYGANYNQERQNMQNAMQLAPTLQNADYTDINAMLQAGNNMQNLQANNASNLWNSQATSQEWNQAQGQGQMGIGSQIAADQQGAANAQYQNAMQPYNMSNWYGQNYGNFMGQQPNYQGQQISLATPQQSSVLAAGIGGGMAGANLGATVADLFKQQPTAASGAYSGMPVGMGQPTQAISNPAFMGWSW
jgi:hypothetical protein